MVDQTKITFGTELEWSDIDRAVEIPRELGSWEGPRIAGRACGSEIDIVNTKGRWRGVATDPLCMTCPVGGEIHVQPTYTIESQLVRILRIMNLFNTVGVACPNHGHIHVGVPGILSDLEALKNVFRYTRENEFDVMRACNGYDEEEHDRVMDSTCADWVKSYLLIGDAKQINPEIYDLVENSNSVEEVLEYLRTVKAIDYDWVTGEGILTENSHRTAINLYNLTRMETIEFRVFRASINPVEIYSSLYFSMRYIQEALLGHKGKPVREILKEGVFRFAPLDFDEELALGWQETRKTKGSCGPLKKTSGSVKACEDKSWLDPKEVNTVFDRSLLDILELCKLDFEGKMVSFE